MRNLAKMLILVLLSVCLFCPASFGEKFVMKSGELITGEMISYDGKTFRVKSSMGILSIELSDIEKIEGKSAEGGIVGIFTGAPAPQTPDRITGAIEYVQDGELRIKTDYGYVVINVLNKMTGIDLKPTVGTTASTTKSGKAAKLKLRSEPATLSQDQIQQMIREKQFSCPAWKIAGLFKPEYETQSINGVNVVIEHNTGLMWQQAGSAERMEYTEAQNYIMLLNRQRYAGFADWRLPTMEEWMSLMEPIRMSGGLYIDPVFETKSDGFYWSADKSSSESAWFVDFDYGYVRWDYLDGSGYVRAVRS